MVCIICINDIWCITYTVASSLILIRTTLDINTSVVTPMIPTRRIAIIPKVGIARNIRVCLLNVVYEVVMVKFVVRRLTEVDATAVDCYVVSVYDVVVGSKLEADTIPMVVGYVVSNYAAAKRSIETDAIVEAFNVCVSDCNVAILGKEYSLTISWSMQSVACPIQNNVASLDINSGRITCNVASQSVDVAVSLYRSGWRVY